jgi:hypothetical protein
VGDGFPIVELTGDRLDAVFSRVTKGAS